MRLMQRLLSFSANPIHEIHELEIAPILTCLEGLCLFVAWTVADFWVGAMASLLELSLQLPSWYGRVGTASKVADDTIGLGVSPVASWGACAPGHVCFHF